MSAAEALNSMTEQECREALRRCCSSSAWVERMLGRRPYASDAELNELAENAWWGLARDDWLEAFAGHPRIGDLETLRDRFPETAGWASGEQAGVRDTSRRTLSELAEDNRRYEERFGYVFIVCATGKSAEQMLRILRDRLRNEADVELRVAAAEQLKITLLRLGKLVS